MYHPQLAYRNILFLAEDSTFSDEVVLSLMRYWPKVKSTNDGMFLNEIEGTFEVTDPADPTELAKVQGIMCN